MLKNVLGICDLHNSPLLGRLTESRPLGAVTFLGRYGLMDFTLSNFSNSGIDKVAILVKNHYYAISSHVQSGQIWVNNTKTGFQKIIYNENCSNELFNTDIFNILSSRVQLENSDVDYIVLAPVHFLASIDFRPIIESHIENHNDITVVYTRSDKADKDFLNCSLLNLDPRTGIIKSTTLNSGADKYANVSLDTFIFTKEAFNKILFSQKNISTLYSINDMVYYFINSHIMSINSYAFTGGVFPILNIEDYVKHSFDMLSHHNRQKLFLPDWPIYTTTHNTPPSLYGKKSKVKNCFIANGSIIKGKVENSIISRDVVVEEGAEIKNCIIFTNTYIGKDVHLKFVVCDKGVKISQVKNIGGDSLNEPLVIAQGVNV